METMFLESHIWVPWGAILLNTRNICSKELVWIIYRTSKILFPEEKIEVYILPAEHGCYLEKIKVIWGTISLVSILWFVWWVLTYKDSHQEAIDSHQEHQLEMMKKCLDIYDDIWDEWSTDLVIDQEKISELCEDHWIRKMKNHRLQTMIGDENIQYEETVIKVDNNQILYKKKIERKSFEKMIVPLSEDKEILIEDVEWTIELISLVVKQKKSWKWKSRQWVYYWDDIVSNWLSVLLNGDELSFFMQDATFKNQIKKHLVTFWSWDNITVRMDLKGIIKFWEIRNLYVYIKEVISFNDKTIYHKVKSHNPYTQWWLFV